MKDLAKLQRSKRRFAVCVDNSGYPASLERWKIYELIPDRDAAQNRYVRVMDESGEDYLYPAAYFRLVDLPPNLRRLYRAKVAA